MISAKCWGWMVNSRLSLRRGQLTDQQLDEVREILSRQGFNDARLCFAVNAMLVCLSEDHRYLDLLRHLLVHGHDYRDPNRPKPKPVDPDAERVARHADMLNSLRHANDQAVQLGYPTIVEPKEWLTLTDQIAPTEVDIRTMMSSIDVSMNRKRQISARTTKQGIKAALVRGESRESVLAKLTPFHADAVEVVDECEREIRGEKANG